VAAGSPEPGAGRLFNAGFTRGRQDAARVLDLEYHTEMMRACGGDMPDVEVLPLGVEGRREWLMGYAAGMVNYCAGSPMDFSPDAFYKAYTASVAEAKLEVAPRGRAVSDEEKDAVLDCIGIAWKMQPSLRLGQLANIVARKMFAKGAEGYTASQREVDGLAFIEDGDLAHNILLWAATQEKNAEERGN
jgi:hypothetical protein